MPLPALTSKRTENSSSSIYTTSTSNSSKTRSLSGLSKNAAPWQPIGLPVSSTLSPTVPAPRSPSVPKQTPAFDPFNFDLEHSHLNESDNQHLISIVDSLDAVHDEPYTPPPTNPWTTPAMPVSSWQPRTSPSHDFEDESEFDPTLQYHNGQLLDMATIEEMSRLSLAEPSVEEQTREGVDTDMSPEQLLKAIFTDLQEDEVQKAFEENHYDIDATMEWLLQRHQHGNPPPPPPPTPTTPSKPVPPTVFPYQPHHKRQVCRHFLAGECYRKDCWYSHELEAKVCKFWLQGSCLKGEDCEFNHHIDVETATAKLAHQDTPKKQQDIIVINDEEYPDLSSATTKRVIAQTPKHDEIEDEPFPSLGSKPGPKRSSNVNFATVAKKKASQPVKLKPSTAAATAKKTLKVTRGPLTRPVDLPWLQTGTQVHHLYMEKRQEAIQCGLLRNRLFARAASYYLKGDGAKARAYSNEARRLNNDMRELHRIASQQIFEQRNQNEAYLDLHGLHVDEALPLVEERLQSIQHGILYVVTGTGHHSQGSKGQLQPALRQWLDQHQPCTWAETSIRGDSKRGVFAIDLQSA